MLTPEKQPLKEYVTQEYPWILDVVQEKFDDALDLLEYTCMVYGGAVRDVCAGLPIGGDLDIAVPKPSLRNITGEFSNSVRWVPENMLSKGGVPIPRSGSGNPTTARRVISNVKTFQNHAGASVQIIAPSTHTGQFIQGIDTGILDIVNNVDIVCCGLLSDVYGTVYEIVPNALKDCKERVLNFNHEIKATPTSVERLKERIKKLEERGWKNNIDLSSIKLVDENEAKKLSNPFDLFGGN